MNLLNKNNISPLHHAVKKNKDSALAFALAHNTAVQFKAEKKEEERIIKALQDTERSLPLEKFKELITCLDRETRRRPLNIFSLNVQCGRKKQTVIHVLADLENCDYLARIVNFGGGVLESLDFRVQDVDYRRPLEFPIIKSPCYKLLQFAEN